GAQPGSVGDLSDRVPAVRAMVVLDREEHAARRARALTDRFADDPRAGADDDCDRSTGDRERHPDEEPSQAEDAQGPEHDGHDPPDDPLSRPNETERGSNEHEDSGDEPEDEPVPAQEERSSVVGREHVGQIDDAHQEDEDPPDQTEHERDRNAAVAYHGTPRAGIAARHIILRESVGRRLTTPRGRRRPRSAPRTSEVARPD